MSDNKLIGEYIPEGEDEDIAMTLSVGEMADSVLVLKKVVKPVKVDTNRTVKQRRERKVPQYPSLTWVISSKAKGDKSSKDLHSS